MRRVALAFLLLTGCSPQELAQENVEQIIIDRSDSERFKFSDFNDPHMGYVERENGNCYSYTIENNKLRLETNRVFKSVYKVYMGHKEGVHVDDDTFTATLTDSISVYKFYY